MKHRGMSAGMEKYYSRSKLCVAKGEWDKGDSCFVCIRTGRMVVPSQVVRNSGWQPSDLVMS